MATEKTTRVLGIADYEARWVDESLIVELTARGILPCANYHAQLERRPERVVPAMWELAFYVQNICINARLPFEKKVFVDDAFSAEKLIVHDAAGRHEVMIRPPLTEETSVSTKQMIELDLFTVHGRLPKSGDGPHGCIVAPYGTLLPAIYYRVFGPAPLLACEDFKAKHCQSIRASALSMGTEVPWPLAAREPAEAD